MKGPWRGASLLAAVALGVILIGAGMALAQERVGRCASVPFLADDLLGAPDFTNLAPGAPSGVLLPVGWSAAATGVQIGDFTVSGSGRSFQLLGIANHLRTPDVAVRPGVSYCAVARALADSVSSTRARLGFHWLDGSGNVLRTDWSGWQEVRRWNGPADTQPWSLIGGGFIAPSGAVSLAVTFHPASDDRVYLDAIRIRPGRFPASGEAPLLSPERPAGVSVLPWPNGARAALSFSFDWETTMGGLIHSRSVDDPNFDQDPVLRGMRMREGVTTTVELFRPYGIRATYYATGYNFLTGNREQRRFMGDPTFTWANRANRWQTDAWQQQPWFSPDPYGTVATDPAWYFGDLIPLLQREGHDIQSHTFSHLYGGLASAEEWRGDLAEWRAVAAERGVPPARSLAFPWSGSAGMSFANWQALADAGITSVTRTNWNPRQPQYHLVSRDDPHCRPVPGHETILACPDFYLTERSAAQAPAVIERAVAAGGMIDLWAHTEEVVSPTQIAAWGEVVRYAAMRRDAGDLWIAPLAEIADRQQAITQVHIEQRESEIANPDLSQTTPLRLMVTNRSARDLEGLTLGLPFNIRQATVQRANGNVNPIIRGATLAFDLAAGETVEVTVWLA
ncbi:MAG: polysaccharide deacetylase family protein [Roseiflexus sp.]|nr:polysaccharide deacetylase family protein [Roseiflexus sp.]